MKRGAVGGRGVGWWSRLKERKYNIQLEVLVFPTKLFDKHLFHCYPREMNNELSPLDCNHNSLIPFSSQKFSLSSFGTSF